MKQGLDKIIGLPTEKERARIDILASHRLGEPYPHTLLHGIGGTGKTHFGRCLAAECGGFFREKEAASLRSRKDTVELLVESDDYARSRRQRLILFIDEIHRLTPLQQEVFYFPMVEWRVDQGDDNWYEMRPFTLMGATTQLHLLDEHSFQKRFQNVWEIKPYSDSYMVRIISGLLSAHKIHHDWNDLKRIATVCCGIPRTAKRLCVKLRNHCVAHSRTRLTSQDINRVFLLEGLVQ